MKKTLKIPGIIVFIAVIGLLMTSAAVWNSKTPKNDRVSLYYPGSFQIEAVNGETKSIGPIARVYPGKGSWEKGKLSLIVDPGETILTIGTDGLVKNITMTVAYNFEPGGHYRLVPVLKPGISIADAYKGGIIGVGESPWDWRVDKIK
jgi:hypothetical protein